ncbi:hypothetical protein HYW74_00725 [Candidatus Pacearchaeota archaeon]|nr:hypothetical protein [Candidatus Pacearchaeota archaeon]
MNLKEKWQSSVTFRWGVYGLLFGLLIGILNFTGGCHFLNFFGSFDTSFCNKISIFSITFEMFLRYTLLGVLLIQPIFILTISLFYFLIGLLIGFLEKKNLNWFKWGVFGILISFIFWAFLQNTLHSRYIFPIVANKLHLYLIIILPPFMIGASISRIVEKIKGKDYFIKNIAKKIEYIFLILLLVFSLIFFVMNYYGWYKEFSIIYKSGYPLEQSDCDNIPNTTTSLSYYISCYKDRIIGRDFSVMCDLLGKPNFFKSSCYRVLEIKLAVKPIDNSICSTISILSLRDKQIIGGYYPVSSKEECYKYVVKFDVSIPNGEYFCSDILDQDLKTLCFTRQALVQQNSSICNTINTSITAKDRCINLSSSLHKFS